MRNEEMFYPFSGVDIHLEKKVLELSVFALYLEFRKTVKKSIPLCFTLWYCRATI